MAVSVASVGAYGVVVDVVVFETLRNVFGGSEQHTSQAQINVFMLVPFFCLFTLKQLVLLLL